MSENRQRFRTVLVDEEKAEEQGYETTDTMSKSIEGQHICYDAFEFGVTNACGVVDIAEYEEGTGVIAEITIYDAKVGQMIKEETVQPAPLLITDSAGNYPPRIYQTYISDTPPKITGASEVIE